MARISEKLDLENVLKSMKVNSIVNENKFKETVSLTDEKEKEIGSIPKDLDLEGEGFVQPGRETEIGYGFVQPGRETEIGYGIEDLDDDEVNNMNDIYDIKVPKGILRDMKIKNYFE